MNKNHINEQKFSIPDGKNLPGQNGSIILVKSKKRKKTITLTVKSDSSVIAYAPFHISHEQIKKFIDSKKEWLKNKITEIQNIPITAKPKKFQEGETFPYLGRHCSLKIKEEGYETLLLANDIFFLNQKYQTHAKKIFRDWYKKNAGDIIRERTAYYSHLMSLHPEKIKITSAQKRWGSCSRSNALNFPWKLICLPLPMIDYVVIHELAHIKQKNHSRNFWDIVYTSMPDYKIRKKWLKEQARNFECVLA